MHRVMKMVEEFHRAFRIPIATTPGIDSNLQQHRMKLLEGEYHEYRYAERDGDLVKVADALADMIYVIAGTAHVYGIPLEQVFAAVHRSNMSKMFPDGPHKSPEGKVLKGPNYHPPKIDEILSELMYGADEK